jgi:hypothetical protein
MNPCKKQNVYDAKGGSKAIGSVCREPSWIHSKHTGLFGAASDSSVRERTSDELSTFLSWRQISMGNEVKGVAKGAGIAVFSQILMALVVKTAFDAFFRNAHSVNDLMEFWRQFMADVSHSCVIVAQLFLFLFTIVRFYWGAYRYHEETPETGTQHFIVGIVGAVLVFSGFYITAVYVANTQLFYAGLFLVSVFDLVWFAVLFPWVESGNALRRTTSIWVALDLLTLLVLGIFLFVLSGSRLWMQGIVLLVLLLIGLVDFRFLWGFYENKNRTAV